MRAEAKPRITIELTTPIICRVIFFKFKSYRISTNNYDM